MLLNKSGRYILTLDVGTFMPDGHRYDAVWGDCKIINIKEEFGFSPGAGHSNFYVSVNDGAVIIPGCQINGYALSSKKPPVIKLQYENGAAYSPIYTGMKK